MENKKLPFRVIAKSGLVILFAVGLIKIIMM